MKLHRHIAALAATAALAGMSMLDATPVQAASVPTAASASSTATQGWSCREATASVTGARISASICWKGSTAKAAGQVYDTKGDRHSGCGQVLKSTSSALNYCARRGAGTSVHFVTGEFHFSHPVWIRACTEHGSTHGRACSAWR
ncbi:hypothetical protein GCM10022420_028420 [Streptomyces iranensis]|uniref:Secreted protein n=1 Tax=Streptomyces iranensis TaxID=576784 RepID=A0A061A422_9ACTN|nr:hypothetical protein [Streptomyces iranensis]CDR17580.1 predicted protein [Streptomyces iranensis]